MRNPLKEGLALWAAAALLALPPFLFPLYNPDLFWHLSAGRWMAEHGRFVTRDFLSFTMAGAPWSDFEWLTQLHLFGVHRVAGMAGLWVFKAALMGACCAVLIEVLRLQRLSDRFIAGAVVVWSAGNLPRADLRPEQFSVLFFSGLLLAMEWLRHRGRKVGARELFLAFIGFAFWANLHAGFVFGFLLLACYAAAAASRRSREEFLSAASLASAGFIGTLVNPTGLGPYRVMLDHWGLREDISLHIQEWAPTTFANPYHQPFWVILAALLLCIGLRFRRGVPVGPSLASLALGFGAVRHARLGAYFVPVAVVAVLRIARDAGWLERRWAQRALPLGMLAYTVFLGAIVRRLDWPGFFDGRYIPAEAAEFMARERPALEGLRLYNPWEWGGYLGWRLYPWHKVFQDGRYIFHGRLGEVGEAVKSVEKTKEWVDRQGFDGLLLRNVRSWFITRKAYPDGSARKFLRPWYLFTFPKERWALVYWDGASMLMIDRRKVPAAWLKAHEYRWVRPLDDDAFAEALARKEIPADAVAAEAARHKLELLSLNRPPP